MDIIGQLVEHRSFGSGVITDLTPDTATVLFQNTERKFVYPDAFGAFLTLVDSNTRRYVEEQIRARKAASTAARKAELAERSRKNKLLNFTVTANSHAVFHVAPELLESVIRTGRVTTGKYLSGCSKGQPRIADRLKPNSLCLIATRHAGELEDDRVISGAFMVREDFFGKDAADGIIEGHPIYRLFLPRESKLLFWQYFRQNSSPRWGNTSFKYCSAEICCRILRDMSGLMESPSQEAEASDFFRYFCKINRIYPHLTLSGQV